MSTQIVNVRLHQQQHPSIMPPKRSVSRRASRSSTRNSLPTTSNDTPPYLQADFDPNSFTKPQLMGVFSDLHIPLPPSTARKSELVQHFLDNVQPKAATLRKQMEKQKPSDFSIARLDDNSSPIKTSRSSSRTARNSSSSVSSETKRSASRPRKESTSRGRSKSRKPIVTRSKSPAKSNNAEIHGNAPPKSPLKAKEQTRVRSTRSKSPKKQEIDSRPKKQKSLSRSKSPEKRLQDNTDSSSPLSALRNALPNYVQDSPRAVTNKLYDRLRFIASVNNRNRIPSIRLHRSWMILALRILLAALFALLFTLCGIFFRYKFIHPLPYCPSNTNGNISNVNWWTHTTRAISLGCVPCPEHGDCRRGSLYCHNHYIARSNIFFLNSSCVPDLLRLKFINKMIDSIRRLLEQRLGVAQCGGGLLEQQQPHSTMGHILSQTQLARLLRQDRHWSRHLQSTTEPSHAFDSIFQAAISEILLTPNHFDLIVSESPIDKSVLLHAKKASLSFYCKIKVAILQRYRANRHRIIPLLLFLFVSIYFVHRWRHQRHTAALVEELVQTVLQILAEQDAIHRRDPTVPSSISIHQIRDALFLKASNRVRVKLWPMVCRSIAHNSSVRESVMSIRGESHRVWEWIGSDVLSPLRGDQRQIS